MKEFELTPTPDLLIALSHTDLKPIDALCEFIDNSIDSFADAGPDASSTAAIREINIDIPTSTEVAQGRGRIRISDNGPGMTAEKAQSALTAGYSGQGPHGKLGMFGMGLNIAASKFARNTRLITATKESEMAIVVDVNLEELVEQKSFVVHPREERKSKHFPGLNGHGTIIELSDWWHDGNPNRQIPKKLVQNGPGKVQEMLGRRYATLLRESAGPKYNITVKGKSCQPFQHCVWDADRYVERVGLGIVKAQIQIPPPGELLKATFKCTKCDVLAKSGVCPIDKSHAIRNVEERVHGWIGVQRYDDPSHFGIDLIRNGRMIRKLEKDAFFTFETDEGVVIKDYPLDSPFGRIVGEIHLNHVRVDFAKQDFIRSTPEWKRAMEYIRGSSSLQIKKPGADKNNSPMMRIFRGYRRVRTVGRPDMYMGERRPGDKKPERVSRELEKQYYEHFLNNVPGYGPDDDAEWWKKVEEASRIIDPYTKDCPSCAFQNPADAEVCGDCEAVLRGKECVKCQKTIRQSALVCVHCQAPQHPEGPWPCVMCGYKKNPPDAKKCIRCHKPKGSVDALNPDVLLNTDATKDEFLSIGNVVVNMPEGKTYTFVLEVYNAPLRREQPLPKLHLPVLSNPLMAKNKLQVFVDKSHHLFSSLQLKPEHAVALECAIFVHSMHPGQRTGPHKLEFGATTLQGEILHRYWNERLSEEPSQVRQSINVLMDDIRMAMSHSMVDIAKNIYESMPQSEIDPMRRNMQDAGEHLDKFSALVESGKFFHHIPPETVISVFCNYTARFFSGTVWKSTWDIQGLPSESAEAAKKELRTRYLNCLEDVRAFLLHNNPESTTTRRARMSVDLLTKDLEG